VQHEEESGRAERQQDSGVPDGRADRFAAFARPSARRRSNGSVTAWMSSPRTVGFSR
jgi:hypothetical protein